MARTKLIQDRLTYSVIGACYEVYYALGFGFLEHVYIAALARELRNRGHEFGREVSVPVFYKGEEIARQRLDMIVDRKLVVEIKSNPVARDPKDSLPRVPPLPRAPRKPSVIVASGGNEPRC